MEELSSAIKKTLERLDKEVTNCDSRGEWFIAKKSGKLTVKRTLRRGKNRSFQRLPVKHYVEYRKSPLKEFQDFVMRLNGKDPNEVKAKQKYKLDSAYFSSELMEGFRKKLEIEIPSQKSVNYIYRYAIIHFIHFFQNNTGSPDPVEWYKSYQDSWAEYLVESGYSLSVIKKIIQSANRLMRYLHRKRPDEVPLMVFTPLNKSLLAEIRDTKERAGEGREKRKYINEDDYNTILDNLCERLAPEVPQKYWTNLIERFNPNHKEFYREQDQKIKTNLQC